MRVVSMAMQGGLPAGVAAFVGREGERSTVADLVTRARVVTLTGSGGCGKTRLAVEVAAELGARFADGARWVDLQGISEPELVAAALAAAVDVREQPGEALTDTLADHLHGRHLLVVIDNCEHLVQACAELVGELSSACPHLHVLATSRVPLAVGGETTFVVAGLSVPGPDACSVGEVAVAAAARLFELRARQVASDFRIDDDNAAAVAEICRRLDGMPLAIELAAVRVRVLAPGQIAAGLSDRFGLLTGGVRGAPARQRTLEASLGWSYDLLDAGERLALARLSVFAGSFELEAAREVVGGEGIDGDRVLDLVTGLVEQSLVQVIRARGSARYRLLETVRAYAQQRLPGLDDPHRLRERHLAFYVRLAGRARTGLMGGEPRPWVARLTAELDDLRAAMGWAADSGNLRAVVDLTEPIVRFWFERGLSREVHRRLRDAARAASTPGDERVRGLIAAAGLALAVCEPVNAHESANEAVDAAGAAEAVKALAVGLGQRAWSGTLSGLSTSEEVDADVERALAHAERCGDPSVHAYVLAFAGAARFCGRSVDTGRQLFEQAVAVCEVNGLTFQLPAAHASLGSGLGAGPEWTGRLDSSTRHAQRAVELSRQVGRPGWEAWGLTGLGAAASLRGDHGRAKEVLAGAQAVVRDGGLTGSHYDLAVRHWIALSGCAAGDLDAARAVAAGIARTGRGGGSRWDESIGEWLLGTIALGQGRDEDARQHLETSRARSTEPRLPFPLGRSLLGQAELARRDDEPLEARQLAHEALELLHDYGDRVGAASALETVADLAVALGEPDRALRLLGASHRFHADAGIVRFPADAERFERACRHTRAALGPRDAATHWAAGTELVLAEAVAYARRGRGDRGRPQAGWASLTPAELEVVRVIAEGHTNTETGRRLFMSVNTVKKHLSHVYEKLDVEGRSDLVAAVVRRDP